MQSVWRIVLVRIFFSVSLAATSSGLFDFLINNSAGCSCCGTVKCRCILPAALELMAPECSPAAAVLDSEVGALATGGVGGGNGCESATPLAFSGVGMTSLVLHVGHWISEPAAAASTASSCSQVGQLNMTSIKPEIGCWYGSNLRARARRRPDKTWPPIRKPWRASQSWDKSPSWSACVS